MAVEQFLDQYEKQEKSMAKDIEYLESLEEKQTISFEDATRIEEMEAVTNFEYDADYGKCGMFIQWDGGQVYVFVDEEQ